MTDQTFPVDKLRTLLDGEGSVEDKIQAIYDNILTPALPDPLFLAPATHPKYGEGLVTSHYPDEEGNVSFMFPSESFPDGTSPCWGHYSTLTFHTLETPETPVHPEFLESEEDYRSAPEGTIVARNEMWPYVLTTSRWEVPHQNFSHHDEMVGTRRRVLRWGPEA